MGLLKRPSLILIGFLAFSIGTSAEESVQSHSLAGNSFHPNSDIQAKSQDVNPGCALPEKDETTTRDLPLVTFSPPAGWELTDESLLSPRVKMMAIGKGNREYPPSINVAIEDFEGSLKDYLKIVKSINESQGNTWKDLGRIRTQAGNASLSQVDRKTTWGTVKMMHAIIVKSGTAYIMTAASRKDEFSGFYKEFFNAIRSLNIAKQDLQTQK